MKAAVNKKLLAFMILLVLLLAFGYFYRLNTLERSYQKHLSEAIKSEKNGSYEKAFEEYQQALKSLPFNDSRRKSQLEKKIIEIKKKIEKKKVAEGGTVNGRSEKNINTSGSKDGNSVGSENNAGITTTTVFNINDLSALLPEKVFGIDGVIGQGKNVVSARYDDVLSRTTYIIYINRFESAEKAANFAKNISENIFSLNRKVVECAGNYAGIEGYYGENEQKDAALYFSYGNLAFELLLRSETLEQEKKLERLLELQKEVKKP